VGGVLMRFIGRMQRGCGKILGGVKSSLVIPNLRWEMTSRLDYGVWGVRPSKKLIRICFVLLALRMLLWQIIWIFLVVFINET
jgi:hypothetical protein